MGGDGGGQGDEREVARLTGAVLALEGSVSGLAAVLEQQGEMLRALLELAAAKPGESRLDELLVALIGRLDAHAGAMARLEARFGQVGAAVERLGQVAKA